MGRDRIHSIRRLFLPIGQRGGATPPWQPLIDVYRIPGGWLIKADLAGVRLEDVDVSVTGARLTIGGTRRDCVLDEGCCHYRLEISYSRFERTIELPDNLEHADIVSEFRDGMLLVRITNEARS